MKKPLFLAALTILVFLCGCNPQESSQQKLSPSPEPTPVSITLAAVGDNLIHKTVYLDAAKRAMQNPEKEYDFLPMYQLVADRVSRADIAFFNQETPLGGTQIGLSDYPLFNSPQELGNDMVSLGFDVVNHASNHILDRGEEGIANTIQFWKTHPEITMLGINDGTYPEIQYTETKGIKIAWLSYGYGTNGLVLPEDSPYSVHLIDEDAVCQAAREARSQADLVIVSLHWGNEYHMEPSREQQAFAAKLSRENVDLIIGHHPHVIQPVKTITRPDGKPMLIAYSLGNFISAQDTANSMLEGLLEVEFTGIPGDMQVSYAKFNPLINHFDPGYCNFMVYPFEQYTSALANSHGVRGFDQTFSYEYMDHLIHNTIQEDFLTGKNL